MAVFKSVLAATDFSDASSRAIELAVSIARSDGAELTLLHVVELPMLPEGLPPVDLVTPLSDAGRTKLDALLAAVCLQVPGARRRLAVGSPWEEILRGAEELGADLVVVGTHGRRGVSHAILGSVAERVVRLSKVPVLTVRGPAR